MPESFQMPGGEATFDQDRYVVSWRAFADRVAGVLGGQRVSYDPGLTVQIAGERVELSQAAAERLHALALEIEYAGRLAEALRSAANCHDDHCARISEIKEGPCDCSLPEREDALEAWDRLQAAKGHL